MAPTGDRMACTQGLHLAADAGRLLGRAQNGFLWSWDLSRTLGWQGPPLPATPGITLATMCGGNLDFGARTAQDTEHLSNSTSASSDACSTGCDVPQWFTRGEGVGTWLCCDDEWQQVRSASVPIPGNCQSLLNAIPFPNETWRLWSSPVIAIRPATMPTSIAVDQWHRSN